MEYSAQCRIRSVECCFLVCAAAVGLLGQSAAVARISGTVLDAQGAAIPAAEVTLKRSDTGFTRTVLTDTNGSYVLPNLPVGPYRMEVRKEGFAAYVQS